MPQELYTAVESWTLPFCLMVNRDRPDEEAVKISPAPELSTVKPAKEVLPEIDAVASVPVPFRTSRVASVVVVPSPTRLPLAVVSRKRFGVRLVVSALVINLIGRPSLLP